MHREIDESTKIERAESKFMNSILGVTYPVLDHGFIRVIDYMGTDESIVQAARVSYGAGTKKTKSDAGLINYLLRHQHTTPFEMCEIKLHVKMPMFVARQWHRHRTASINEYSARYSVMERMFYVPEPEQMAKQSTSNKQGRAELIPMERALEVQNSMREEANRDNDLYEVLIDDTGEYGDLGLSRELARMSLPMSTYTQFYWKTNLHNLFNFTRLRADSHAQWEIQRYAKVIEKIVEGWCPAAYNAYETYTKNIVKFSVKEQHILRSLLNNPQSQNMFAAYENLDPASFDVTDFSKGEWNEMLQKMKLFFGES